MKKLVLLFALPLLLMGSNQNSMTPEYILKRVDENMYSKTKIMESTMIIHGKRGDRSITSKGYTEGNDKAFTEYLSPARERGTKMLKLKDNLWIYSPSTDRTIQISGHMLKQSVMGSDLSYEDMMEDRKLLDLYSAKNLGKDTINGREAFLLQLDAKVPDVSYVKRKTWIDAKYFVPLKEELYAKSGQMLKRITLSDVKKVGTKYYPHKMNYKDMLSSGKGTDFVVKSIQINPAIPPHIFTKASLKK
jgi:outer membrane lipoprotein-sorting protein